MALSPDGILKALRRVADPERGGDVVELDYVKNIKIGGGNVAFDLDIPNAHPPVKDRIRQACLDAIKALPEVSHVSINMFGRPKGAAQTERRVLKGVKYIIAVASGKGGVGKSTTATNLAVALADLGASVGVLDADIYGPSVPTMIQLDSPPAPLPDQKLKPAEGLGLKIISMAFFMPEKQAAILRGPMVSGYVSQFLANVVWGDLDFLIIDYPPGTGDIQLTLSQQAPLTGVVIATTPQEISLADVRRAITMFETTGVPVLGVCETMSYFVCDGCGKRHEIFRSGGGQRIADQTGVPLLAAVPIDPRVAIGSDAGMPIVRGCPDSPAAEAFRSLAVQVKAQAEALEGQRGQYLDSFVLEWK